MQLYIHVPFCRQKCAYCAFYSIDLRQTARQLSPSLGAGDPQGAVSQKPQGPHPDNRVAAPTVSRAMSFPSKSDSLLDLYCQTLITEISQRTPAQTAPVRSIFLGGGTPSLLSSRHLEAIFNTIQRHYTLTADIEITIEANPESAVRPGWLNEIRSLGVNRLSLGIQSFTDSDLKLLGRCHNAHQAKEALRLAHKARFSSISLDLMWGLPWLAQNPRPLPPVAHWLETLKIALECAPHHISAYGLILEEGTPLAKLANKESEAHQAGRRQSEQAISKERRIKRNQESEINPTSGDRLILPADDEEKAMYLQGAELLSRHGFNQYEISNYALPGHQCRHNLGYWQGGDYLGFGPAAVSTLGTSRFTNVSDFERWTRAICAGHAAGEAEELPLHALQEEKIMLSLRMAQGLDVDAWNAISPQTLSSLPFVRQLLNDGLATFGNGRFALTPTGMLVSNAIISRLFEYIPNAET